MKKKMYTRTLNFLFGHKSMNEREYICKVRFETGFVHQRLKRMDSGHDRYQQLNSMKKWRKKPNIEMIYSILDKYK